MFCYPNNYSNFSHDKNKQFRNDQERGYDIYNQKYNHFYDKDHVLDSLQPYDPVYPRQNDQLY